MRQPSCAFLTIADLSDYVHDDELAAAELRRRGWRVEALPWPEAHDWSAFDLVVIRSTWDYHRRPQQFLRALARIERSAGTLANSLAMVRWNIDKRYLAELQQWGVATVPTTFVDELGGREQLWRCFEAFETQDLILKPTIGASAHDTFRLRRADMARQWPRPARVLARRPLMVQPFMPSILEEGEYSLIYLQGAFSHAILKRPAPGDFRAQEEHGGRITAVEPPAALLAAGQQALEALPETPLYARADLVRDGKTVFRIMELELIEPSLYLRMDPAAPSRFADALQTLLE